MTSDITDK